MQYLRNNEKIDFQVQKKKIPKFFRVNRDLPESENFIEYVKLINHHRLNFIYYFTEYDMIYHFKNYDNINFESVTRLSKKQREDKAQIFKEFKKERIFKSFIKSFEFTGLLFNNTQYLYNNKRMYRFRWKNRIIRKKEEKLQILKNKKKNKLFTK